MGTLREALGALRGAAERPRISPLRTSINRPMTPGCALHGAHDVPVDAARAIAVLRDARELRGSVRRRAAAGGDRSRTQSPRRPGPGRCAPPRRFADDLAIVSTLQSIRSTFRDLGVTGGLVALLARPSDRGGHAKCAPPENCGVVRIYKESLLALGETAKTRANARSSGDGMSFALDGSPTANL